jgi:hypothetical protein
VLKPDGQLVFDIGPQTLKELKAAWAEVDTIIMLMSFTVKSS